MGRCGARDVSCPARAVRSLSVERGRRIAQLVEQAVELALYHVETGRGDDDARRVQRCENKVVLGVQMVQKLRHCRIAAMSQRVW
jgi:hypothetical protein